MNKMLKTFCLTSLAGFAIYSAASAQPFCVYKQYHCRNGHSVNTKNYEETLTLHKIAPGAYNIAWQQRKDTPKAHQTKDSTLWFIYGNRGIASFHGIIDPSSAKPGFYSGAASIVFSKNSAVTTFYGHSIQPSGKVFTNQGNLTCESTTTECVG